MASLLIIVSPVAAFYNRDDYLKIIVNSVTLQRLVSLVPELFGNSE